MIQLSNLHNKMTMAYCDTSLFRSIIATSRRTVVLSRTTMIRILMMIIVIIQPFSYTIAASSSDLFNSSVAVVVENNKHHNKVPLMIQPNHMVLKEPISISSIKKLDEQKKDEKQLGHNHLNDHAMTTTDVAIFRNNRMTQDCITEENGLRLAVSNAPSSSTIAFDINLCAQYIPINSEIIIWNKFIQFNCIFNSTTMKEEKCTLDAQMKSRHFVIQSSNVSFKQINFINGRGTGFVLTDGGSLFIISTSTVEINDCNFNNNIVSDTGGAIYAIDESFINMVNVTLMNNTAGYWGGAISLYNSDANMTDIVFSNNRADQWGGAVCFSFSTLIVTNSNFSNNKANSGGALYSNLFSTLTVTNTIFTNNNAIFHGSCLYSRHSDIKMTNIEAYDNGAKCEVYQKSSSIEISNKPLEPTPQLTLSPTLKPSHSPTFSPIRKPTSIQKPTLILQPTTPPQYSLSQSPSKFSQTVCVTDEVGLKLLIQKIPDNSLTPTNINLCVKYIAITVNQTTRYSGINIINKFVNIQCTLGNATEKCIIDAKQQSRHFYIKNAKVSFDGLVLMNGNVNGDTFNKGGSLWIDDISSVKINDCDFIGCVANAGGAVYALYSTIQMTNVNLKDNIGGAISSGTSKITLINGLLTNNSNEFGGAIDTFKSTIIMTNVDLTDNTASEEGGAVKAEDSVISMTNVSLSNNSALKSGGVIASRISNVTLTNVVMDNNSVKNGTITLLDSRISLQEVSFTGAADGVATSDLLFGAFNVDDNEFRYSRANLPETPPPQETMKQRALYVSSQELRSFCIDSCIELIDSVKSCQRTSNRRPCRIYVCNSTITCSQTMFETENSTENGIDASNKDIFFDCLLESPTERCILDGSSNTRLFYGSNTNVEFNKFIFANGYDARSGGGMKLQNDSAVSLLDCTFSNCSAPYGSSISLNNTFFLMEGTISSIVNSTGTRASIELLSSNISLYSVHFSGNDVWLYDSEIIMFDSTINAANLSFETDNKNYDCKIYVAMYRNEFPKQYSCIGMNPFNNTIATRPLSFSQEFSFIQSDRTCFPISTPKAVVPSCFSDVNKVQGLDGEYIHMNEIKIGSFIKAGDGEFTQVYGFGHMDPSKKAVFLKIHFDYVDRNLAGNLTFFSFIEVSPMHLIYVERKNKIYTISASDVVIGDTLNGMAVRKIETVARLGLYSPLTYSGDFIVNGVTASNYVNVLDHEWIWDQHVVGHILFFPQRIFCSYFMEACKREKYIEGYGYLAYVIIYCSPFFEFGIFNVSIIILVTIGFIIGILRLFGIKTIL